MLALPRMPPESGSIASTLTSQASSNARGAFYGSPVRWLFAFFQLVPFIVSLAVIVLSALLLLEIAGVALFSFDRHRALE